MSEFKSFVPTKALDEEGLAEGKKRFRFVPLHKRLAAASARPAALPLIDFGLNLEDVSPDDTNFTHFSSTLSARSEENITAIFVDYVSTVKPLSLSLPLLFRNRSKIVDASYSALIRSSEQNGEATSAISSCFASFVKDIGPDNFYPFFPRLITTMSHILDPCRRSDISANCSNPNLVVTIPPAHDNSLFWEPDVTLIPLFSLLSEISKILLILLMSHPQQTIAQLLPLLSHPHYRVREMTAEASLGYVIRKTRDESSLRALVLAIFDLFKLRSISNVKKDFAIDGFGVSLYESVRLSSGRLHPRAIYVLQTSLRKFGESSISSDLDLAGSTKHESDEYNELSIVSRCFAGLCRTLTDPNDAQSIGTLLLTEGSLSVSMNNWAHVASILFLMRNWIYFGGSSMASVLPIPFRQRVLNFVTDVVGKNPNDVRLVYELFQTLSSVQQYSSEHFKENSVSKARMCAMERVATASKATVMLVALRVVVKDRESGQKTPSISSARSVARICNRLLSLPEIVKERDERDLNMYQANNIRHVLQATLSFFLTAKSDRSLCQIGSSFYAPAFQNGIVSVLTGAKQCSKVGDSFYKLDADLPRLILEYFSVVPIIGDVKFFGLLGESCSKWTLETCAAYLAACARQQESCDVQEKEVLMNYSQRIIYIRLFSSRSAWQNSVVCWSVFRYLRAFRCGLTANNTADVPTSDSKLTFENVINILIENLSSKAAALRLASLSLLIVLEPSTPFGADTITDDGDTGENVQVCIQSLRRSLMTSPSSLMGIFESFIFVMRPSRSLEGIQSRLLLLQELARLVREVKFLEERYIFLLAHFCLGLFQTPVNSFWQPAGDLLCFLVLHNDSFVMPIVVNQLRSLATKIIVGSGRSKRHDKNEEASDDQYENEDHVILDEGEDGARTLAHDVFNTDEEGDKAETEEEFSIKQSVPDAGDATGNNSHFVERSGCSHSKRKRPRSRSMPSKRQREKTRDAVRLHWNLLEWRDFHSFDSEISSSSSLLAPYDARILSGDCTDDVTVVVEIIRAMTKEPKNFLAFREDILSLYFMMSPNLFSRSQGDVLSMNLTLLLEKMGGLNVCGSNENLTARMRERLLSDLCRFAPSLQSASLRCLCAPRSAPIKAHREALLRLIDDKSFREELALLTESGVLQSDAFVINEQDMILLDTVLRICFSKLTAKKSRTKSQKGAVLSFISSRLPSNFSLPRITSFILDPIKKLLLELESSTDDDDFPLGDMPVSHVQFGLLGTIEALVKYCRHSLPTESWKKLVLSVSLFLKRAGSGPIGQNMRSKALRLLSVMIQIRPDDTLFVSMRALSAVKSTACDSSTGRSVSSTPALLRLLSALFKSASTSLLGSIFEKHQWVMFYCFRVVKSSECDVLSVEMACDVVSRFLLHVSENVKTPKQNITEESGSADVFEELALAFSELLTRLISCMSNQRSVQRKWCIVFNRALGVIEHRLVLESNVNSLIELANELGSFLQNTSLLQELLPSSLRTLSSILRSVRMIETPISTQGVSLSRLFPLLSTRRFVRNNDSYDALCDLLAVVGGNDLQHATTILKDLNSMSKTRLEEPDWDRRVNALNIITTSFKNALGGRDDGPKLGTAEVTLIMDISHPDQSNILSSDAIIALCHGCVAAVYAEDTAVRGSAGYALKLISRWTAFCDTVSGHTTRRTLYHILLDSVVTAKRLLYRRWPCIALGEFVRNQSSVDGNLDEDGVLRHLQKLSNAADLDTDVFENLVHLQAHRRSRALRHLEKHITAVRSNNSDDQLTAKFSSLFVLPLSMQMALEKPDVEERLKHFKHQKSRDDVQKEVAVSAIGVVGVAACSVGWPAYKKFLDNILRMVSSCDEEDRAAVPYKLLVRVVEAFPTEGEWRHPGMSAAIDYIIDTLIPKMLRHVSVGATNELLHHDEKASSVFVQVGRRKGKSYSSFRAPIAIALGKVMAFLPEERLEPLMPLLITPLSTALRSRMISTRESAKKALSQVCLYLGSKYLLFVLRQVLSALNEGFRKDMCVYVIQSLFRDILDFRKKVENNGCKSSFLIDDCIELLTQQLLDELKGGASNSQKDYEDPNASDNRLKLAAARAFKAQECAETLGELIVFQQSAKILCVPFLECLCDTSSGKLINRLENLLRLLLRGLSKNPTLIIEDALKFCYNLATERNEELVNQTEPDGAPILSATSSLPKLRDHRWVNFALQLLNSVLNKHRTVFHETSVDAHHLSMLQPFLAVSLLALKTGQDNVTLTALKSLQNLMKLPLPGRRDVVTEMSDIIVDVLSQNSGSISGNTDYSATNELFNICLRSAAVILKEIDNEGFSFVSKARVDALIDIACGCLESGSAECRSASIVLLRAVVSSKAMLPALYDSIEKVNRLAIFAQSSTLRSACISLSIQFLMSFPLRSSRVRQHMEFFVQNINYKLASGRLAALEAIQQIISKFPPQVLEKESQYLLITLTANVARDDDEKCRLLSFNCMQILFKRLPPGRKLIDLLRIGMSLTGLSCSLTNADEKFTVSNAEDHIVKRSGIACLSAACKSNRLSALLLKLTLRAVILLINQLDDDDEWETLFSLLQCTEFIFEANELKSQGQIWLESDICTCPLWNELKKFLLHRNQWVRLLAARLAGRHMSACGGRNGNPGKRENGTLAVWDLNEIVRDWIKASCLQLESNHLSFELGQQCLKNILCMADVVRKYPMVGDIGQKERTLEPDNLEGTENYDLEDCIAEAEGTNNVERVGRMLRWTVRRMCGIAFKGGQNEHDFLRRACAFRFLLVTVKWWGLEIIENFKQLYILPVVKVLESGQLESHAQTESILRKNGRNLKSSFKNKSGEDDETTGDRIGVVELKKIAELVQLSLLECVGNDVYFQIYHNVRSRRTAYKLEQKRKAAVMVAANPERAAKEKRSKARVKRLKKFGKSSSFSGAVKDTSPLIKSAEESFQNKADNISAIKQEKKMLTDDL